MELYGSSYDDWKLACCDQYPYCEDCPYDKEPEDDEEQKKEN